MDKKVILSVMSGLYILALVMGSFLVKPNSLMQGDGLDYPAHIIGFLVLFMLLFFTFKFYDVKSIFLVSISASLALGIIVELLRIPGRGFSIADLAFDVVGILLGLVIAWIFSKR
jgi:VanZ family protein